MAIITTLRTNVQVGAPLRDLAIDASISGSTITYTDGYNHYLVEDRFLAPEEANAILQVPDTEITDYRVTRFIKTDNLANEFPTSIPNSSITEGEEGEEVTRKLTFAEVDARDDRSIPQYSDELYYCKASICGDCQGLTLDEYNACVADGVELILQEDLPAQESE